MFPDFTSFTHDINGIAIHGVTGGKGPPLLLLHGYPQTHVMWHKVAPALARDYRLVIPDLRGYGASAKPPTDIHHMPYSKREMAKDMIGLMSYFDHAQFGILAHDRGARVAHRLAVDHADRATAMILLDIAPTREMYANTTAAFATVYWHWFWLIQAAPFPERQIEADPLFYLNKKLRSWGNKPKPFTDEAFAAYAEAIKDPATIHAMCEDYRAAASIDIDHDNEGGRVTCPLHVLWGADGAIEAHFDCLALWKLRADHVTGNALPGGHYLAEELPEQVIAQTRSFFAGKF
jgi:haloacetate dehalogenase